MTPRAAAGAQDLALVAGELAERQVPGEERREEEVMAARRPLAGWARAPAAARAAAEDARALAAEARTLAAEARTLAAFELQAAEARKLAA